MAQNITALSAASRKMHLYAVFVLKNLHEQGKLVEDFDPMSLDMDLVSKFDAADMTSQFKAYKKEKNSIKVVASRKDLVSDIANEFYNDDADAADKTTEKKKRTKKPKNDAENTEASDSSEKKKRGRKPKQVTEEKPAEVASETATEVASVASDSSEKKKRGRKPKQAVVAASEEKPAETASVASDSSEKKKRGRKPKQATVAASAAESLPQITTDIINASKNDEDMPKKKTRKPKTKKTVEVEVEEPIVEEKKEVIVEVEPEKEVEEQEQEKVEDEEEQEQEEKVEDDEEQENDDDDDDEIEARILSYEGKDYLLDNDGIIYDKVTFEELGTFSKETNKITFN